MPKKSSGPKKPGEVVGTMLRMPAGLHQMLKVSASRNNRSVNSEILWGLAHYLGGEAPKFVEHMAAHQREVLHNVLRALMSDPEVAAKAIARFDREADHEKGKG
jgi:plasmid stability protein